MLAALREPLEVEFAGGGVLDYLGPILIAGTAVFAAWLAAHTANRRQREQLDHDRRMRDRDHTRDALDVATEKTNEFLRALTSLSAAVEAIGPRLESLEKVVATADSSSLAWVDANQERGSLVDREMALFAEANAFVPEMVATDMKLRLRLSGADPIVQHHTVFVDACEAWLDALSISRPERYSAGNVAAQEDAAEAASNAYAHFMSACQVWFIDGR